MEVQNRKWNGRVLSGIFVVIIGIVLLLDRLGLFFPSWLFTWPMMIIIFGLFMGLRKGFREPGWLIILAIGFIFLIDNIKPAYALHRYNFPIIVIAIGLFIILRPRGHRRFGLHHGDEYIKESYKTTEPGHFVQVDATIQQGNDSKQDYIDSVAIFGGVRKVIVSKNFRGGDVFALLGGHEIDFSQADFNGEVTLEVTQIFGGTKILLPAHWDVKSEMVAIFGGIEDKRQIQPGATNVNKILILKGTSIFGGIDIRNY